MSNIEDDRANEHKQTTVSGTILRLIVVILLGPLSVHIGLSGMPPSAVSWRLVAAGFAGCIIWALVITEVANLVA